MTCIAVGKYGSKRVPIFTPKPSVTWDSYAPRQEVTEANFVVDMMLGSYADDAQKYFIPHDDAASKPRTQQRRGG